MASSSGYDPTEYFRNFRSASSEADDAVRPQNQSSRNRRTQQHDTKDIISRSNYAIVPLPKSYHGPAGREDDDYEELQGGTWPIMGPMMNPGTALVAGIMGAPKSKLQLAALVVAVLGCGAMMSGIAGLGLVVLLLAAGLLTGGALVVILVCCAMIAAVVTGVPVGYVVWKVAKDRWLDPQDG